MNKAITYDIKKNYLMAVEYYETNIDKNKNVDIDNYINLAFLYWAFASEQIEFNLPNGILDKWSTVGRNKFYSTLDKALTIYPNNIELMFWKDYFNYRLYLSDFSEEDCKSICHMETGIAWFLIFFSIYLTKSYMLIK